MRQTNGSGILGQAQRRAIVWGQTGPSLTTLALALTFVACGSSAEPKAPIATAEPVFAAGPAPSLEPAAPASAASGPDVARGARLFDNFRAEKHLGAAFEPDQANTPELDGNGGPNANGTLNDGSGKPMANTGHDYRLKNLFGWDLRGASGIYGPAYHAKPFVLPRDLLADTRSAAELARWLRDGDEVTPAYGSILDERDLDDLVEFLVQTRTRAVAYPTDIFELAPDAPKSYRLLGGADVLRGHERYEASCAECHGRDGRKLPIDETSSAGAISRAAGYETWFKIQHGHPGSDMLRQVNEATGAENSRAVLELLAALCDRTRYPALDGQTDVPDGDARCGAYLK